MKAYRCFIHALAKDGAITLWATTENTKESREALFCYLLSAHCYLAIVRTQ